jgi:long-chain acyl-CoA synthetase
MITGSAPLAPAVMDFLRAVFGVPVVEGYGQTENGASGTSTDPMDYTTGHVGVPSPASEIALFDVPEMGYMSTDKVHKGDNNVPCRGRGEICMRGPNLFKGYYKQADKTAETIDSDGWLHSGDIGAPTPQTLSL